MPSWVSRAVWRGNELGSPRAATCSSGWESLDQALPGGGWPCRSLTEVLCSQYLSIEWRLLAPALRERAACAGPVVAIGPPAAPHWPGLQHAGLSPADVVWIQADTAQERLWTSEQLLRSNAIGAVLVWLPQSEPQPLRRLQAVALDCDAPAFLFRPHHVLAQACAAPLRLQATHAADWALQLRIVKRRGPAHEGTLILPSVPGGLQRVLTPRVQRVSSILSSVPQRHRHAVGRAPVAHTEPRLTSH